MQAGQTLQAVVVDYKAVFQTGRHTARPGIADLLGWLQANGISWVLLTSDPFAADAACDAAGLPRPVLHLDQAQIPGGKRRGSQVWLETVAARLDVPLNALLMIGTSEWDWLTGINAGVMYFHAKWANSIIGNKVKVITYMADTPDDVREFIEGHLLEQPSWAFGIDDPARSFRLRSLFLPDAQFPRGRSTTFKLQNIFTYGQTIKIGEIDARSVLMFHLLASAYLDGDLGRAWFCVYPSSTPGRVSEQIGGFLAEAKVLVGSHYKQDLLERAAQGRDTSRVRYNGGQVTIADQTRTVRVNPDYKGKLRGKTVIVFDDFTTAGMSLEWARNLLLAAGAEKVIALTVGKYRKPYTFYELRPGTALDPYNVNPLTAADFATTSVNPGFDDGPLTHLQKVFGRLVAEAEAAADRSLQVPGLGKQPQSASTPEPGHPGNPPWSLPAGRALPMPPYKQARQSHLAIALTALQRRGALAWRGQYVLPPGQGTTAVWWISLPGRSERWYGTRDAEELVLHLCGELDLVWEPVAAPGGQEALRTARAKMVALVKDGAGVPLA